MSQVKALCRQQTSINNKLANGPSVSRFWICHLLMCFQQGLCDLIKLRSQSRSADITFKRQKTSLFTKQWDERNQLHGQTNPLMVLNPPQYLICLQAPCFFLVENELNVEIQSAPELILTRHITYGGLHYLHMQLSAYIVLAVKSYYQISRCC